jgi:hypothetical protein
MNGVQLPEVLHLWLQRARSDVALDVAVSVDFSAKLWYHRNV